MGIVSSYPTPSKYNFFPAVCLVVGLGCYGDYEFCQAGWG